MFLRFTGLLALALFLTSTAVKAQENTDSGGFVNGDALPNAPELSPRGSFLLGVQTVTVTHPDQVNIMGSSRYDRPITFEVWYPAQIPAGTDTYIEYSDTLRDGITPIVFKGRAVRDAVPDTTSGPYPVILISHGHPGSRIQLNYLSENLASKGYIVAAISHTDSTYTGFQEGTSAFLSSLLNRALDDRFVLDSIEQMSAQPDSFLYQLADVQNVGLIGYSMGGMGVLNLAGAGFNATYGSFLGGAGDTLLAGNPAYAADPRVKAVVAMAPFGADLRVIGRLGDSLWDAEAFAALTVPVLFLVGDQDDIAGYEMGVRRMFEQAVNSPRHLLVFENAAHNVPSPPPPAEAQTYNMWISYGENAWDSRRLNNIVQHFATAFMNQHLRGNESASRYFDVPDDSANWPGFVPGSALGLHMEHAAP